MSAIDFSVIHHERAKLEKLKADLGAPVTASEAGFLRASNIPSLEIISGWIKDIHLIQGGLPYFLIKFEKIIGKVCFDSVNSFEDTEEIILRTFEEDPAFRQLNVELKGE